jgi:hypothetical protein
VACYNHKRQRIASQSQPKNVGAESMVLARLALGDVGIYGHGHEVLYVFLNDLVAREASSKSRCAYAIKFRTLLILKSSACFFICSRKTEM